MLKIERLALAKSYFLVCILLKHQSLFQIEALLFGASGLLNIDFEDETLTN